MRKALSLLSLLLLPFAFCQEELAPYAQTEIDRLHKELAPWQRLIDREGGNLARGCSYEMSEKPSMGTCTGESDATDLTNGKADTNSSGVWFSQDCVGWSSKELVTVTIDLKEPSVFGCAKVFCGAGRAGVQYPSIILIEASDDGKDFRLVSDLAATSKVALPRSGIGYQDFVFAGDFAPVRARFVRLVMRPVGQYLTINEIEVLKSDAVPRSLSEFPVAPNNAQIQELGKKAAITVQIRKSMMRLIDEADFGDAFQDELSAIKSEIASWNFKTDLKDYKALYPLCPAQEKIFALNAKKMRKRIDFSWQDSSDLRIVPVDFYENISPVRMPRGNNHPIKMKQVMRNGEVRAVSIALCNTTEKDMLISATLEGISGEIYETGYLDSEFNYITSTCLIPHTTHLRAIPGMVCELNVVLRPNGLKSGMHEASLKLTDGTHTLVKTIEIEILDGNFPKQPQLTIFGWDYLDQPVPGATHAWLGLPLENFPQFRKLRKEELCTGIVGFTAQELAACVHAIEVSPEGDILSKLDFSFFDKWVRDNPQATLYGAVAIGQSMKNATFGNLKLEPGSEPFNHAIEAWARIWQKHIDDIGLTGKFFFQLLDEPGLNSDLGDHESEYILIQQWHTPFHRGAPQIPLFINPCGEYQAKYGRYLSNGEIICPEADLIFGLSSNDARAEFEKLRADGHEIQSYSCSYGPFMGEPGAFRAQGWMTFAVGGKTTGFWGTTELKPEGSFNRYVAQGNYFSPYLIDANGLHCTKHSFALRDSVQDFEYLVQCKALLDQAEAAGRDVKELRLKFDSAVSSVTVPREHLAKNGRDIAVQAELARRNIINIIKSLKNN